jgi:hypothetical protein
MARSFSATSIFRVKSGLEWTFGITETSGSKQEIEKAKMRTAKWVTWQWLHVEEECV